MAMKKVQSYIKNLGKSVKYASVDVLKDMAPTTAEFTTTNADLFKQMAYVVRERKTMFQRASRMIQESKIYEAGNEYKKSLLEDIKSGNFYNKERKEAFNLRAMGSLANDDLPDVDFNFDDDGMSLDDDNFDISDGDAFIADTIESNSMASATMISTTVARSSEYIVESQKAMNEFNMLQNLQHFNNITNIMKSVNDNISKVITFNDKAQIIHIENSKKFYEETTASLKENNALLKELVEMERNRYSYQQEQINNNSRKRLEFDDIITASGTPDLKAYFDNVMKNINTKLGSLGGMNSVFGEDSNILLTFAASPLEFIPKLFVSNLIDKNLKSSITKLDKSIGSFFSALITRFNTMANDENNIIQAIGEIFGVRSSLSTSVDTSKYNKGAVPWDGKARQALVEVIPSYLAKLVSLQSGTPEKIYDYETGKFVTGQHIAEQFASTVDSSIKSSTREVRDTMEEILNKTFAFRDLDSKKTFDEDMDKFFKYFFETGQLFDYRRKGYNDYDGLGLSSENNYNIIKELFASMPRSMQMQFYKDILSGRDRLNKTMRSYETGDSIYRYIGNDFGLNEYFDKKGNLKSSFGSITGAKDASGRNVFFYLEKIARTLLEGIIVYPQGGMGGSTPGRRISGGGSGILQSIRNRLSEFDKSTDNNELNEFYARQKDNERFEERELRRMQKDGNLTYIDDVENDNFTIGGVIKTKRDIDETKSAIEKAQNKSGLDSFIEDLLDSSTLYDKYKLVSGRIQKVMEAPSRALSKVVDRVDLRLFEIIYGKEEKDYRGEKVSGFLDMMMVDLRNTFNTFNKWLDEKILTPLSERLGGLGSKLVDGILMGLGINMTSADIKKKVGRFFFGEKDEDGDYISKGILSSFSDQVKEDFNLIKTTLVGRNSTLRKVYRLIKEYTIDETRHNDEGRYELLFNIQTEMKKFKSSIQDDMKIAKSIKENLSKMKRDNLEEVILNIYDLVKSGGYDDDTSTLNDLKQSFKKAKDYVFGENTVLDRINRIIENNDFTNMNIFQTNADKLNPNKFYALIDLLRDYMNQSSIHGKKSMLTKIAYEISNIHAENDDEKQLKKQLGDIFKSHLGKLTKGNANQLAIDLLNKLKSYIHGASISNIINLYSKIQESDQAEEVSSLATGVSLSNINDTIDKYKNPGILSPGLLNNIGINSIIDTREDSSKNSIDDINKYIKGLRIDGSHAEGIKNVPKDNYLAILHKDERVLTKEEKQRFEQILNMMDNNEPMGFKTGSSLDRNQSIYTKLLTMLDSFNPQTEADAASKKRIKDILDKFTGNNIDEILNQVLEETEKNREDRGVKGKKTLLENVIDEFNSMFKTTKKALFGSDKEEEIEKNVGERLTKGLDEATKDVFTNIRQYLPKMGSGALLGAGLGILPGIIGGPVMWAGIGASTALIRNSEKVQNYLFGEIKDGERQGGVVDKRTLEAIGKYAPDTKKYGLMGAALGLLPVTPFGIVGGLMLGTATAFAKNNAGVQDFLFGESGLIGKDAKTKIEKFLPKAVVSTILTGVGTKVLLGSAFGPFGLVGGVMMGSALALFSQTTKFQEMLFGKKDKDGKTKGGLFSFLRETFLDTKYFVKENILKPLADSVAPLRKELGILAKGFAKKVMGAIDWAFEKVFGSKVSELFNILMKPVNAILGGIGKGIKGIATAGVLAPVRLLTYFTDSLRIKHAKSDNPDDYSYMTEEEREEILSRDKFGRFGKTMFGKVKRRRDLKNAESEETSDSNKIVNTIKETSDETVDEIKRTNTTLGEIMGYIGDIGKHLGVKIQEKRAVKIKEGSTEGSALDNPAQKTINNIDKKPEKTTMLTPEGEIEFQRDHKGKLKPVKEDEVYDIIKQEESNDNKWQEMMLEAIERKEKVKEDEEGKNKGIFGSIGNLISGFIPKLLPLIPGLLIALPLMPDIVKGLGKILGYFGDSGVLKEGDAESGTMEGGGIVSGLTETISQSYSDKNRIMFNFGRSLYRKGSKVITGAVSKGKSAVNFVKNVTGKGSKVAKVADTVTDAAKVADTVTDAAKVADVAADTAKGVSLFTKAFNIFKSEKVIKIIGKEAADAMLKIPAKLSQFAGKELLGTIGKKLTKLLGPVGIALAVYDLVWGMSNAEEVLEMVGELPFGVKLIAGLVNVLNNQFTLGLVPKKWLLTTVIKLLPGTAIDERIAEGQAELKKMYETYSKTATDPVDFESYTKNYKKYNKQVGLDTGKGSTIGNSISNNIYRTSPSYGRYGMGSDDITYGENTTFPFYSQKDRNWASMRFNTRFDKTTQTIGDSGCGPTSAAMVITALTGNQVTPDEAAKYAINNNFKEPNGGTYPEFFTNFSDKYGVKSVVRDLNDKDKDSSREIQNTLRKDIPVILMGKSETNSDSTTPFGRNPHYVVATGLDKTNKVIIHDPSSKEGGKLFNLDSVLRKSTLGIISTYNGRGYEEIMGEEAFLNMEGGLTETGNRGILARLLQGGKNLLSKLFGKKDADEGVTSTTKSSRLTNNEFVQLILPSVLKASKKYGVLPSIIMAQAVLESGWGKSKIGNNLFGIKAGKNWKGKTQTVMTTEYTNGVPRKVMATFRDYNTIDDSILDHSQLLSTSRYAKVRSARNYKEAAKALQEAGYATDPRYAVKLINTIESNGFHQLDGGNYSLSNILTASSNSTGQVTGEANIHTWLINRLKKLSEDNGNKPIHINSGYRTIATQQKLWDEHKRKYPNMSDKERNKWVANPKANPGSMHLLGLAADISTPWVKNMSKAQLAKYGIWRPLNNEPWHFEAIETGYPKTNSSIRSTLRDKYGTPDNPKYNTSLYKSVDLMNSSKSKTTANNTIISKNNSLISAFGRGTDRTTNNSSYKEIFEDVSPRTVNIPKIDTDKYLYGTNNQNIGTVSTRYYSDDTIQYRPVTQSNSVINDTSNKLLIELVKLIAQIVQNTNNLSEIVKLLSEGLNINIPEDKLKSSPSVPINVANILSQQDENNSDITNMISMLNAIASK